MILTTLPQPSYNVINIIIIKFKGPSNNLVTSQLQPHKVATSQIQPENYRVGIWDTWITLLV